MNRKPSIKWGLILPALCAVWMAAPRVEAQVQGWCEEKLLAEAQTREERVSAPSIAVEGGDVYIAYRQRGIRVIHSSDNGKTWSDPVNVEGSLSVSRDPAVAVFGPKVVVVFAAFVSIDSYTAFQLYAAESADKGATWSEPKRIVQSRDHTLNPKFVPLENQALLVWLETPLAETLGGVSTMGGDQSVADTVEDLYNTRIREGGLADQRQRVRSRFFASTYTPRTGAFTNPNPIDEIFASNLPAIFTAYGPLNGNLFLVVNENTDIKSYQSTDMGSNWSRNFDEEKHFDPRMVPNILVVDGTKHAAWIRRDPFQEVAVNYFAGDMQNNIQLSPPHYVRSMPQLAHGAGVFHAVWEAGFQNQSRLTYMRTDEIPPTSQVVQPASPNLKEREAVFGWRGEDNISASERLMYSHSIQEGEWSRPQSETTASIQTPPDGEYVFRVRAEDVAGNIQSPPAEFAFNTYQSAPDTTIVQAPPPDAELNTRSVEIEFASEDNTDPPSAITYSAKADDEPWTEFAPGTSHLFENLSNGPHVLQIRTKDSRGNIDPTPARCQVRIRVGLELVLDQKPPLNTNEGEIVIAWTAKDDKGNPVELDAFYSLNGGEAQRVGGESQINLDGLDEGRHTITLWGVDPSGDRTADVKYQWVIDRTPPETTAAFTKEYRNGLPVIQLAAEDPVIGESVTPVTPKRYEYRLGADGEWKSFEHQAGNWFVPNPLSFVSWGYVLNVRAIDAAGNVDASPASVDLRLFTRTNPYILYGVAAVLGIVLVLIMRTLLMKMNFGARKPASSGASSTFDSTSSPAEPEAESASSSSSRFKFDEDEEDPYK